jgi:hypothetical protein
MNPAEIALWVGRLASVVPALVELWNVITSDTPQPDRELAAAMELVRATKAAKAREELGG